MKIVDNVKAGTKATGGFIRRHKVAAIGIGAAILAAVGAIVGIKVSKDNKPTDEPATDNEPSDEPSEE